MSDWISWEKLLKRWDILESELLEYLKKGLQPYSGYNFKPIPCPNSCHEYYQKFDHCREISARLLALEEILNFEEDIKKTNTLSVKSRDPGVFDLIESVYDKFKSHNGSTDITISLKDIEKLKVIKNKLSEECRKPQKDMADITKNDRDCISWKYFIRPLEASDVKKVISSLRDKEVVFKLADVDEFSKSSELGKFKSVESSVESNLEDFICNLRISYENDNEIKIQKPGKKPEGFNFERLDFKSNQTDQWKTLIKILQDPDHMYDLGPASTKGSSERKVYDSRRSLLQEINKKLIKSLNKEYNLQIPGRYKLYKKYPAKGSGVYKFKFQVLSEDGADTQLGRKFRELSNDQLKKTVAELAEKFRKTADNKYTNEFIAATKTLKERKILTDNQLNELIEPIRPKKNYIFDPYENVEDLKPKH